MTRVIATIQVRMGSSRLPGKIMLEVEGKPLLGHLLDRVGLCRTLTDVIVAMPDTSENDVIEQYCRSRDTKCFRGSENDVLGRMVGALKLAEADIGVEVFGDGPLIDPQIVDEIVSFFFANRDKFDFVGNDLSTTFPPGMEVEVFTCGALENAAASTTDPLFREHGTFFIRQHPELYRLHNIEAPPHLARPELEIEVDTDVDLQVVGAVLAAFRNQPDFSLADIIAFLDAHPEISTINCHVPRRWKEYRNDAGR
jgi:spore coat polysaccharide biosynthesis protein SpsF